MASGRPPATAHGDAQNGAITRNQLFLDNWQTGAAFSGNLSAYGFD
jgi:hypothetical protein